MTNYYQHKIYCDLDFKSLLSIAADYFESIKYYEYSTEEQFKNSKKLYQGNDRASFSVVFAKSLIDLSGSVMVVTENLKAKFSRGELKMTDLPLKARQRFENMPNILTIDLHRFYYKDQIHIVEDISNKLKKSGFKIYDDCFNGQLLSIYDNIIDEEEKIKAIQYLIYEYFETKNLPKIDLKNFSSDLALLVSNFNQDSLKALHTGEFLYNIENELYDYSPVVIEYCKIVEIEIFDKILQPLKQYFNSLPISHLPTSNELKKLKGFINSKDGKSIELGTFANTLEILLNNNLNDNLSEKIKEKISNLPFQPSLKSIIDDIYFLTRNFRNKAAHKAILTKQDMINCRKYIMGDINNIGLIGKLVNIA